MHRPRPQRSGAVFFCPVGAGDLRRRNAASRRRDAAVCRRNAPPILFCLAKRECAVHGGREKRWRGLWDAYGPNAPQKRESNSPMVGQVSVAPTARRACGGRCRSQQPTYPLRLKGFPQPLAAADWRLKGQSSPKGAAELGAPLWVPVFGAGAVGRTPRLRKCRPSGRERSEALARPRVLRTKTQNKKSFFSTGRGAFSLKQGFRANPA